MYIKKGRFTTGKIAYMQHQFQWAHDGTTHDYDRIQVTFSSPYPRHTEAAEEIPGDSASGMNIKQHFCSGSTRGARRCTPESLRQLKCQVPRGR
jgi:hypothetical protein